jgi:hypothetical protein
VAVAGQRRRNAFADTQLTKSQHHDADTENNGSGANDTQSRAPIPHLIHTIMSTASAWTLNALPICEEASTIFKLLIPA